MKADALLRHDYTLGQIDELARRAVMAKLSWWSGGDRLDQIETARSAIVEHLYVAEEAPTERELYYAAQRALQADKQSFMSAHGINRAGDEGARFIAYWDHRQVEPSCEDRIVEILALRQIFPTLRPQHQRALVALAATGTYQNAARALGANPNTFQAWITRGRAAFRAAWHEGEQPSRSWGLDRRAGATADVPIDEDWETTAIARIKARKRRAQRATTPPAADGQTSDHSNH